MSHVRAVACGLGALFVLACSGTAMTGGTGGANASGGNSTGGSGGSGAASSGGAGATSTGGGGGIKCSGANASFPTFDRTCTTANDCVLVSHLTSCCGSTLLMSIASNQKAAFDSAEKICDAQYPACGCASMGINVEDGTLIDDSQRSQVVSMCDSGKCAAHYTGETFACGDLHCTPQQICWITTGGPAGSPTGTMCQFSGGCSTCSCTGGGTGCTCVASSGHLTVTCAAP